MINTPATSASKAMSLTSNTSQVSVTSELHQAKDPAFAEEPKPAYTFTTLPLEIRLQINGYFLGPIKHTLRRRAERSLHSEVEFFNTSLLAINKQINAETVPIFYANHTFHYDASRRSSIPSHSFKWLKHASIDISTRTGLPVDVMLATQIQELDKCCPALRTLTVHFIKIGIDDSCASIVEQLSPHGLTAKALQTIHPRLDRLSIVVSGYWRCLEVFRQSVTTADRPWVEEVLANWPVISLIPPLRTYQVWRPRPLLGGIRTRANLLSQMSQEIHAYHLFGPKIAKRLQEGQVEKKDWFFAS